MKAMDGRGAFSGAPYFILANIGNTLAQDPKLPEDPTGQDVLDAADRLAGNVLVHVGVSVELLGIAAWMIFVGYVYWRTRAAGWLAAAALVRGIVSIAVKFGSVIFPITTYLLRDEMDPRTASVFDRLGVVSFMIDLLPAGLFVACAAAAMISGVLGRVLGWAGVVFGVVNVIVMAVTGFRIEGTFAASFLLVLLWVLVVSLRWGFSRSGKTDSTLASVAAEGA